MMNKHLIILGLAVLLICIGLNGCVENNVDEIDIFNVDDDGGYDFIKIQDALDAASDGDTIIVHDGTYYEVLTIDKSISLIGTDRETTIIHNQNVHKKTVVTIDAEACVFKKFKVIGPTITNKTIGIKVNTSDNVISNNNILNTNEGIYLGIDTRNNSVYENIIKNNNYGISTQYSSSNVISNNEISYNILYGIYLDSSSEYNNISGNLISHCETGIRIKTSDNSLVFDNSIIENKMGLLCCCSSKNNKIFHNNFKENEEYNGRDYIRSHWDYDGMGNYWDDYIEKYPDAEQINSIWDIPYKITSTHSDYDNYDRYPLVHPIETVIS